MALIHRSKHVLSQIFGIGFHLPILSHGSRFCHTAVGNAWRDQYLYDEALRTYNEAYDLLQAIEKPDKMVWLCRTQIKFEQIQTHYWLGQPEAMFSLLDEIAPILTQYGSKADQAHVGQMHGIAALRRDRYCPGTEVREQCRLDLKTLY